MPVEGALCSCEPPIVLMNVRGSEKDHFGLGLLPPDVIPHYCPAQHDTTHSRWSSGLLLCP